MVLATFEFFEIFEFTLNCHECQSNYIQNLSWQAIKLCTCMVNSDNIANSSLYLIVLISYFIKEYLSMSMSTFPRFSSSHFFFSIFPGIELYSEPGRICKLRIKAEPGSLLFYIQPGEKELREQPGGRKTICGS